MPCSSYRRNVRCLDYGKGVCPSVCLCVSHTYLNSCPINGRTEISVQFTFVVFYIPSHTRTVIDIQLSIFFTVILPNLLFYTTFETAVFGRSYLSNDRAIGMVVVVCPSVCPSVRDLLWLSFLKRK